jgi:hypothetical protein
VVLALPAAVLLMLAHPVVLPHEVTAPQSPLALEMLVFPLVLSLAIQLLLVLPVLVLLLQGAHPVVLPFGLQDPLALEMLAFPSVLSLAI